MNVAAKLDRWHLRARSNKWLWYFTIALRMGLAIGFLPSGMIKILGERFTALSGNHPMGHYLDALYVTGYYYTFTGVMQVTAAVLLLIPRTATLGAFIYFPIILNICILSLSVRFEGSLISSPLMVLADLYLLCWDYHKWKYILPFKHAPPVEIPHRKDLDNRFPFKFFAGVAAAVMLVGLILFNVYEIQPRNTAKDCQSQCKDSIYPEACMDFCDCIHGQGKPLRKCLEEYERNK